MPSWLGGAARDEWLRIVPQLEALDLLKEADGPLLVSYCLCWQTITDMTEVLVREGYTQQGSHAGRWPTRLWASAPAPSPICASWPSSSG